MSVIAITGSSNPQATGPVSIQFAEAWVSASGIACRHPDCFLPIQTGELIMLTKVHAPVLAALCFVAVAVPGSASAQNPGSRVPICPTCANYGTDYQASGYQSPQLQRLKRKLPSDAYGSSGGVPAIVTPQRGRPFETDPDPNIRSEMNRDDFDRRRGG
jgi:hypothetical protein